MMYIDVDALSKLAHWNILPLLPSLLAISWKQMATMSSLRYRVQSAIAKPDGKLFHSIQAAKTAAVCIGNMASCGVPDPNIIAAFSDIPQIDAGEAVLFSLLIQDPSARLLTGDKRAVKALARHSLAQAFEGRIICLEQVIAMAMKVKGHAWILENICPQREIDKAVAVVLGSRCDAAEIQIVDGLSSYISELTRLRDPSLLINS